jgi:CRP/FNR family cyclic AMP-dependent transcriptional regulator
MKDLLKKINLFSSLTDDELEEIEKICVRETFAKDTIMFLEGDPGNKCYVIVKGEVRISKIIPNIGEEALAVLKPGDYFGEMALIDNFPRSAHAIANTDIEVLTVTKADLDKVLIRDREMGYKLLWVFTQTLSRRLREMNEKMAGFLTMSGGF